MRTSSGARAGAGPAHVSAPRVSIVLPTRNGAATLPAAARRDLAPARRLPVRDHRRRFGSTDGTADLLRGRVDRLIGISDDAFDHGLTRNLGIEQARGELVVLLVQDALPASDSWLAALTAPLLADERVAGAFARQLPRPDASAVTRYYLERSAASSAVARTSPSPTAPSSTRSIRWRSSSAARSTTSARASGDRSGAEHPFRPTPIAEDIEWAREVLLAGYRLAYVPEAK